MTNNIQDDKKFEKKENSENFDLGVKIGQKNAEKEDEKDTSGDENDKK